MQSQSFKECFREGSFQLMENNYTKAREFFEKAWKYDSTSANIAYLIGYCYLQSPVDRYKAEGFLERACKYITKQYSVEDPLEKSAPPLALYYYGQALHFNYRFTEALTSFSKFRKFAQKDKNIIAELDRWIEMTLTGMELTHRPAAVEIINLGDSINSQWPEYSAVISADEQMIIYTTRRPNSTGRQKTEDGYFEDIVVSYKKANGTWTSPVSLGKKVNTVGHEASINLTPNGQTLIVYRTQQVVNGKDTSENGNIYYTNFNGKEWGPLKEFEADVNSPYHESHACLSADGNLLFFTSERPGGFGGKDIYRCVKLPNGKWSKALNMGPAINTEFDEDGAFIHPDGRTFYFASNGHQSMGGYDIMVATLGEDNKFSNVRNMGYPINTTGDDVFYVTSPDGRRGYLSSAKSNGYGSQDIYCVKFPGAAEPNLALFKGQFVPAAGSVPPDNIQVAVTDDDNGEIVNMVRPNPRNGSFALILAPGHSYSMSYQDEYGEEFFSEQIFVSGEMTYQEIQRAIKLQPVKLGGKPKLLEKPTN